MSEPIIEDEDDVCSDCGVAVFIDGLCGCQCSECEHELSDCVCDEEEN